MYLVIAEKPSVSRAIARVIGAENREEGFLSGKDCIVSWCMGHLAEYLPPDGYDKKYESWKYEDLPIIPDEWKQIFLSSRMSGNWQFPRRKKNSFIH